MDFDNLYYLHFHYYLELKFVDYPFHFEYQT